MKGIAYCAGVGPGDPELMTFKTARLIRENEVIALPGASAKDSVAYKIAVQVVPELAEKTLLSLDMPMVRDERSLEKAHHEAADRIAAVLEKGENVVFLTLGDPTIYCTFSYVQNILNEMGYQTALANGVPSFCAAAARLGIPLSEWDEELHVIPAVHEAEKDFTRPGTYILMKSASRMKEVKEQLRTSGRKVCAVERCGMTDEKVYHDLDEIPDDAGYFVLIIAKE